MSSEVQFDEDNLSSLSRARTAMNSSSNADQPKMIQWMIAHHIARTPAVANIILVAAILVNLIITFVIITYIL